MLLWQLSLYKTTEESYVFWLMVKLTEGEEKRKMALETFKELYQNIKPESKSLHHVLAVEIDADTPNIS